MKHHKAFNAQHEDYVHDIVYDHYGKRIATCSSDHKIKVWSEGADGVWVCDAELAGHRGAVWKLDWAHPEFGQILASCSLDQQVLIWEELDTLVSKNSTSLLPGENTADGTPEGLSAPTSPDAKPNTSIEQSTSTTRARWSRTASLKSDSTASINDIKFGPRHFGLCLATCSGDGYVRIFVVDDTMNLENWTLNHKFFVARDQEEATCLSWNPSRFDSELLVVGTTAHVKVWAKDQVRRAWAEVAELPIGTNFGVNDVSWAPNLGRSYHMIATAFSNVRAATVWLLRRGAGDEMIVEESDSVRLESSSEIWRVKWNITGTVLATSGDDGRVCLWRKNFKNQWDKITEESIGN